MFSKIIAAVVAIIALSLSASAADVETTSQVGKVSMTDTTKLAAPLISSADANSAQQYNIDLSLNRLIATATKPNLTEKQRIAKIAAELGFSNEITDKAAMEISAFANGYGSNYK